MFCLQYYHSAASITCLLMLCLRRFKVLNRDVIVLNNIDVIHDALVTQDCVFAGRPPAYRIQYGFHFADDVIFGSYSSKWMDMKRKASKTLKQFTSGLFGVDDIVKFEMNALLDALRRKDEFLFDPTLILQTAVFNSISATVYWIVLVQLIYNYYFG